MTGNQPTGGPGPDRYSGNEAQRHRAKSRFVPIEPCVGLIVVNRTFEYYLFGRCRNIFSWVGDFSDFFSISRRAKDDFAVCICLLGSFIFTLI